MYNLIINRVILVLSVIVCLQTLANNFGAFTSIVPPFLNLVDFAHRLVGPKPLEFLSGTLNRGSNHIVPAWNEYMPKVPHLHCHFPLLLQRTSLFICVHVTLCLSRLSNPPLPFHAHCV